MATPLNYDKLRELLLKEKYPHDYTFKFIGKNSLKFTEGLHRLETDFTDLKLQGSRESAKGQHLAITYRLAANNADEIISVLKRVSEVEDLMVML
jgi:putative lipoic acid-binding regulatory protein